MSTSFGLGKSIRPFYNKDVVLNSLVASGFPSSKIVRSNKTTGYGIQRDNDHSTYGIHHFSPGLWNTKVSINMSGCPIPSRSRIETSKNTTYRIV